MLVGQQLGPFLIEKELGAGAMGAVYRGKYLKTGQQVAIKVMAPGLGTSSNSASARFEREAKILKQLSHPNIVRLFGVGKFHGTPYYAMEYVQGESLDRVMARRDRMSWEEVVDLGLQLCSALQHAHNAGIVHRDLKPSNLMILNNGTLKLTDFGIAKDLDVTQLTGANCTVGTAAYMSPEQCKGDPHLTHKSDLYSLGVVFYELITGKKPFVAENAMDMFMLHVNGKFERPSRIVLDLPVWLDTLICQLLEKKPEHRPLNAEMVGTVLSTIQEKIEAQESAGAALARGREGIAPEDREAARSLLGKKTRKKKPKKGSSLIWLKALGILAVLTVVVAGIVIGMQPPRPESLVKEAERLWKTGDPDKQDRAFEGPIKTYLGLYGKQAGPLTDQMRTMYEDHITTGYEKYLDRYTNYKRNKGRYVEAQGEAQEKAFEAALAEYDGDRQAATDLWQEVLKAEGRSGIGIVAYRHLAALSRLDDEEKRMRTLYNDEVVAQRREPTLDDLTREAFLAWRQENLGDLAGARRSFEKIREAIRKEGETRDSARTDPANRFWHLYSSMKANQLKSVLDLKPQDDRARVERITSLMEKARQALSTGKVRLLELHAQGRDVVALYGKEPEMSRAVEQALALIKSIDKLLGSTSSS